ncbi:MAG TPA: glycosyltransferase [Gemmatimonadaceae bacterium]|nr:glycosyltransferase [Gemmatimonadaceae bacterium]
MTRPGVGSDRCLTIWILQTGEPLHVDAGDPRPMRAMNLANAVVEAGHRAVVWSSAFSHTERRHRSHLAERTVISENLEYRLIPSPGYRRNISLARLWDHAMLGVNLRRMLRAEKELPDACFIGYPPIETAAVMVGWSKKKGVPTMLDVKDQWPELFLASVPRTFRSLGRVALSPYYRAARRAMRDATGISAMAEGFLDWALLFAGRARSTHDVIVPLTSPRNESGATELEAAREFWAARGVRPDGKVRLCFIGSHTRSFDFAPVVAAARALADNMVDCEFIIAGTGNRSQDWQKAAADLPNVQFPGWISPAQTRVLAELCSGFLAPYIGSDDFDRSVPNKVIDALSLGLPVITPLRGEVAALIDEFGVGLRYGIDTNRTLQECVALLVDDPALQHRMSRNALDLYDARFSFKKVYGDAVAHLERLAASGNGGA